MTKLELVLAQAMELDEGERELLVAQLGFVAVDATALDDEWESEIARRLKALDEGEAQLIEWDEAEKLIFDD